MLKELKAAMDDAAKKLAAKPDDADLKSAHAAAKSAYEAALAAVDKDDDEEDDSASGKQKKTKTEEEDDLELDSLDEKTKAYIKKLRRESAKYRTKGQNLEDRFSKIESGLKNLFGGENEDDASPEEKLSALTAQSSALAADNAILASAIEMGVPKDKVKYYKFLVQEKLEGLKDGEELSEEDLEEIAKEAIGSSASGGATRTGVGGDKDKGKKPPAGGSGDDIDVAKFAKMGITEKSELYQKNPEKYEALMKEALEKRLL